MRTRQETAILLAVLFRRSGLARVRVSETTIRLLSDRRLLKSSFIADVNDRLADYGIYLIELDTGGYALISAKSLEGAKTATVKRLMPDELDDIRDGLPLDFKKLDKEASDDEDGVAIEE